MTAQDRIRLTDRLASLYLEIDGSSLGNPGPAGAGVVIRDARGQPLAEISAFLGEDTNNGAEYRALLLGLEAAREMGARRVEVKADSELLVSQVRGWYRVRVPRLRELCHQARAWLEEFDSWGIEHVPREANARADELARRAAREAAGRETSSRGRVVVSACLAGVRCRYDGTSSPLQEVEKLLAEGRALPVCPEQLGGLPTPREPAEIEGGDGFLVLEGKARVFNRRGEEVTAAFVRGAEESLRLARLAGCARAILREGSPSCGVSPAGVTSALFSREGIAVEGRRPGR